VRLHIFFLNLKLVSKVLFQARPSCFIQFLGVVIEDKEHFVSKNLELVLAGFDFEKAQKLWFFLTKYPRKLSPLIFSQLKIVYFLTALKVWTISFAQTEKLHQGPNFLLEMSQVGCNFVEIHAISVLVVFDFIKEV